MTAVWDKTPYEGGALLVLLALADWANDQGKCWPSVASIARKARLNERQVYNVLRTMRADGVISCEAGGGRGKASVYTINTAKIAGLPDLETLQSATPKPCNLTLLNPAICDNPPDPLIGRIVKEPSLEPPTQKATGGEIAKAAQHVCTHCTLVGKAISETIAAAIRTALKHPDCDRGAMELAHTMVRRWGEYQDAAAVLRYTVMAEKFFGQGLWRPDTAWPYDQQRLHNAREASLGARR